MASQDLAGPAANGGIAANVAEAAEAEVDREIVTTGSATIVTKDVPAAAKDLADLAEAAGGRVEQRRESDADGETSASADLTVRIPADRTTATIEALAKIGDVHDLDIEAADVTGTARDLDARVEALQTSVDRLQDLMESAVTTADLLAAEQELTARQAELESLESQRVLLSDQVAMSTLTVRIVGEAPETELAPAGFLGGLTNGWNALLSAFNGALVVVGVLLPWIVLGLLLWLPVRWLRSRRKAARGGNPPAPGTGDGPSRTPQGPTTGDLVEVGAAGSGRRP